MYRIRIRTVDALKKKIKSSTLATHRVTRKAVTSQRNVRGTQTCQFFCTEFQIKTNYFHYIRTQPFWIMNAQQSNCFLNVSYYFLTLELILIHFKNYFFPHFAIFTRHMSIFIGQRIAIRELYFFCWNPCIWNRLEIFFKVPNKF